jgi:hypothetical protein
VAPDLITGARTRSEDMRSEVGSAGGVSERDARGERTPTSGVDGSPAPREQGSCRPVGKEERAGWGAARSRKAMRPGVAGSISEIPVYVSFAPPYSSRKVNLTGAFLRQILGRIERLVWQAAAGGGSAPRRGIHEREDPG